MLNKLLIIVIIGLGNITAQTFSHQLSNGKFNSENANIDQSEVNILAVMVEFQPDEFDLTKGDGTFGSIYSEDYGNSIIDPLPHDIFYFQDHLEFAKNYYSKVSNGNVKINYTILPNIISVSKVMRDYSPASNETFKVLADFSQEVWALADDQNPNINFSQYNLFVIFHAGVGKDISTSELLGEARDLPSIYLSLNSLKDFYGDTFTGFPTHDGFITNTIILPETESREENGIGGTVLLQLSINGLIVSNIASFFGLPDLFDSETGKSAIGRFGLMDGQSLFAFAGLFPPEPSAWEKIFLGWEEPTLVNSSQSNIEVTAKMIASYSDYKIIKLPINSTEYYLIENRQRDANNDGITVTYKIGGQVRTTTFNEDLDNFNNAIVDTINGVVLDIDEFDWATPGSGILIWHIDEKIINDGLITNRVNVGKNKGVDLEEADGIQDIGEEFQTIFGDVIIAEGDEFDYWYSSNTSKLYENIFGLDTKPNTNSNSGANSLITFSNFSDKSNRMSFDVSFGTDVAELLHTYELSFYHQSVNDYKFLESDSLLIGLVVDSTNLVIPNVESNNLNTTVNFSNNAISILKVNEQNFFIGTLGNQINVGFFENQEFVTRTADLFSTSSYSLISGMSSNSLKVLVGFNDGKVQSYSFNTTNREFEEPGEPLEFFTTPVTQVASFDDMICAISKNKYNDLSNNLLSFQSDIIKSVLTKNREGNLISILLTDDNTFHIINNGIVAGEFSFSSASKIEDFSLGDVKNDGENYIVFNLGNEVHAVNIVGSSADKFPYNNSSELISTPLIADVNSDGMSDIISTSENGNIIAISGNDGKVINGFPISTGGTFSGIQVIIKRENDLLLSSATNEKEFYFWSINSTGRVDWGSKFGNNLNSSSLGAALNNKYISNLFPKNRTYNWPNPVYGNETLIRTYVAEDSEVKVTIFDLAGDLVEELEFRATGGFDNEITWDVSNIQSGAYLAHVEVTSSNNTDSKIIKIAVIK